MGLFTPYFTIYLNRFLHMIKPPFTPDLSLLHRNRSVCHLDPYLCNKVVTWRGFFLLSIPSCRSLQTGIFSVIIKSSSSALLCLGPVLLIYQARRQLHIDGVSKSKGKHLLPSSVSAGIGSILSGHFTGNYLFCRIAATKMHAIAGVICSCVRDY